MVRLGANRTVVARRVGVLPGPLRERGRPCRPRESGCSPRRGPIKLQGMLETRPSLLQRVRDQSDAEGWREFVTLYEPLLLKYVQSRGVPETDARDIVQDIFLSLLRSLPSFQLDRQRGRFRTWLWQVTMNAIADHARRRRSQRRAQDEWRQRHDPPLFTRDQPDPEWERALQRRVLEYVLPQVQVLTQPKTWQCFEQHVLRGRTSAEIGAEVGLTANAVIVNAARVLKKVRQLCADYLEEMADEDSPLPQ